MTANCMMRPLQPVYGQGCLCRNDSDAVSGGYETVGIGRACRETAVRFVRVPAPTLGAGGFV